MKSQLDILPKEMTKLPPIHSQSQCRRFKTEPNEQTSRRMNRISEIRNVLGMKRSRIISDIEGKLPLLEEMNLVQGGLRHIIYAGHNRIPTVHNDYHNSKTKGGYGRSKTGGIYPK